MIENQKILINFLTRKKRYDRGVRQCVIPEISSKIESCWGES